MNTPTAATQTISGKYRTILVDPPWDIEQLNTRGAQRHYSVMTLSRLTELPVSDLATPDAHLWLWVTNATLRAGFDVMDAWGFIPRSPLTWVKPKLGLGNYLRNATEHLILGTRGRAPVRYRGQSTWMFAPVQAHSHKPEEQYAVIERISDGPYLELFARRHQPGWDAWGNEIDSDIAIPGFPVPSDTFHRRDEEMPA